MKKIKRSIFLFTLVSFILMWTSVSLATEYIVIGFTGPLSGPAAEFSNDCITGLDMAIQELNTAGGITVDGKKYLFKLEKREDKINPDLAIANARQLVQDDNALVIYNPVFSTQAALMRINQEECGEFILMSFTSSQKATQSRNELQIVMNAPLTVYAKIFADMAWERGWRKAAMVVTHGIYGEEWRESFSTKWKKLGGTITADKPANYYTKTDYSTPLAAAVATNPDVMLIGGPSSTTALVIEQARQMGYKGGFMLVDQAKMDYIAQLLDGTRLMENVIGLITFAASPAPAGPAFGKRYQANYKRMTTWEVVTHYNSMYYLARAIQVANTVDNVYAIRAALPKAFPQLGDRFPTEVHGISSAGRVFNIAGVQSIKNGKFTQPAGYVWWAKSSAEFDKIKRTTKFTSPLIWFNSKAEIFE